MGLKIAGTTGRKAAFADLPCGAVFKDEDGDLCLKLDDANNFNSVVLDSGVTFDCRDDVEVVPTGTVFTVQ